MLSRKKDFVKNQLHHNFAGCFIFFIIEKNGIILSIYTMRSLANHLPVFRDCQKCCLLYSSFQSCKSCTGSELNNEKSPDCYACDMPQVTPLATAYNQQMPNGWTTGKSLLVIQESAGLGPPQLNIRTFTHGHASFRIQCSCMQLHQTPLEMESDDTLRVRLFHCSTTGWHAKSARSTFVK